MSTESLQEFLLNLNHEIMLDAEVNQCSQAEAFTDHMRGVLTDAGDMDDGETAFYHYEAEDPRKAKSQNMAVSGYSISGDEEVIDLLVTDYQSADSVRTLTKPQMTAYFTYLSRYATMVPALSDVIEESNAAWAMTTALAAALPRATRIRLTLLTNAKVRSEPPPATPIFAARVTYHIWDAERLRILKASGRAREPITIDFCELAGAPLPALGPKGVAGDYEAFMLLIPGSVLADIYELHGPRLLELNVRSFLQARGKVNQGIQRTIRSEPERFLAYNNGISLTASKVDMQPLMEGGQGLARVHDLQIVNGGQTTASLHYARTKPTRDNSVLDKIFVQAKLSVVPEDRLLELVPLISEYANSQNTVKVADFSSNHRVHIELQRVSRETLAPARDGSQRSTRWFYERARGQYADAVANRRTAAEQRAFKEENPPSQVIRKTDLAKFELTWAQLPNLVALGAEKTFREFMLRLETQPAFTPDAAYYQQVVSKAVLFRSIEAIVRGLRLGGYKSQVVAYTMALMSRKSAQRIDLSRIWRDQELPSELAAAVEALAPVVHTRLIASAGTRNVSEWAKRDAAWTAILEIPWSPPEQVLVREGTQRSSLELDEKWTPEAREAGVRVFKVRPTGWDALVQWGTSTKNLDVAQRKACRTLRDMAKKGTMATPSLVLTAAEVLNIADAAGFNSY